MLVQQLRYQTTCTHLLLRSSQARKKAQQHGVSPGSFDRSWSMGSVKLPPKRGPAALDLSWNIGSVMEHMERWIGPGALIRLEKRQTKRPPKRVYPLAAKCNNPTMLALPHNFKLSPKRVYLLAASCSNATVMERGVCRRAWNR